MRGLRRLELADLPDELVSLAVAGLPPSAVCHLAAASPFFAGFAQGEEVWHRLALQCLWPRSGQLLELAACGAAAAAPQGNDWPGSGKFPGWRALFQAHQAAREVLVVDVGFGYTKFGFPPALGAPGPSPPAVLQLCSSATHPADAKREDQVRAILARARVLGAPPRPRLLVGEPFVLASEADARAWRETFLQPQLPAGVPCTTMPQALLALLAHGAPADGLVVNIGQRETAAVPCLGRAVCHEAMVVQAGLGSAALTQALLELLMARHRGVSWDMLTWCRDLKETHCAVSPEPLSSGGEGPLAAGRGEDAGPRLAPPVEVAHGAVRLELGIERYIVPEILFRGGSGLPSLVLQAAQRAAARAPPAERAAVWSRLLGAVAVVGGTAELPGLHERLRDELRKLVSTDGFKARTGLKCAPDVTVLRVAEGLGSPRTAVLHGGLVAAAASGAPEPTAEAPGPADGPGSLVDGPEEDQGCSCSCGPQFDLQSAASSVAAMLRRLWRRVAREPP